MSNDPSRRQAAATLGLPPDADEAAVRAAFLKRLAADDFVPPEGQAAAVNRLSRFRLPMSAEAKRESAGYERANLELFVQHFWRLAPAERARTWERLDLHCSDPESRQVLARLKPGLDVPVIRHEDWNADKLAAFVREIFLLPPRERAVRRMEWLAEQVAGPALVERVRLLRRHDAGTALLDPLLLNDLQQARAGPLAVPPLEPDVLEKIAAKEAKKADKVRRAAERQAAGNEGGGGWTFSWHYIWIFALVVRLVMALAGGSQSTRSTPNYPPRYTPQADIYKPTPAFDPNKPAPSPFPVKR